MKSLKTLLFVFLAVTMLLAACSPAVTEQPAQPAAPTLGIIGLVLIIGAAAYSLYLKRHK